MIEPIYFTKTGTAQWAHSHQKKTPRPTVRVKRIYSLQHTFNLKHNNTTPHLHTVTQNLSAPNEESLYPVHNVNCHHSSGASSPSTHLWVAEYNKNNSWCMSGIPGQKEAYTITTLKIQQPEICEAWWVLWRTPAVDTFTNLHTLNQTCPSQQQQQQQAAKKLKWLQPRRPHF